MACGVQPGSSGGFQKLFFGKEEIAIPLYARYVSCVHTQPSKAGAQWPHPHLARGPTLKRHPPLASFRTVPHRSIHDAAHKHPRADVFINYASFRSAYASSMEALKQPTIRVVAIIAEGERMVMVMAHPPPALALTALHHVCSSSSSRSGGRYGFACQRSKRPSMWVV